MTIDTLKKAIILLESGQVEETIKILGVERELLQKQDTLKFLTMLKKYSRDQVFSYTRVRYNLADDILSLNNDYCTYQLSLSCRALEAEKIRIACSSAPKCDLGSIGEYLNVFKAKFWESSSLVESSEILKKKKQIILRSSSFEQRFNIKLIEYMDCFLGPDTSKYITKETEIVLGESERGKGYVFGLRNS